MLVRPSLLVLGCAAALAVTAATPAVAATGPSTPTAAPKTVTITVPCPPPTAAGRNDKAIQVTEIIASAKGSGRSDPPLKCSQLLERVVDPTLPKGAPETGGGGMAAEVGSWG